MNYQAKRAWAWTLKEGDLVEDCRLKVLKITKLHKDWREIPIFYFNPIPSFILEFTDKHFPALADKLYAFDYYLHCLVSYRLPSYYIYSDSFLTLEDGNCCSAINCCDPPP
jgi:hypothetical protein